MSLVGSVLRVTQMQVTHSIFKAYDIRGVVPSTLNVPVAEALDGLQHFSIVEALTQPGHRLHTLALELLNK